MFINRFSNCLKAGILFCLYSFAIIFLHINNLHAHGVVLNSMGAVSSGRGGTNISHADSGVLIHDNPAALVNMPKGKHLEISLELFYPDVEYDDAFDSDHTKGQVFTLPAFSFIYKKSEESRFAFGAGIYAPAGFGTEFRLTHSMNRTMAGSTFPVSFGKQKYRSEASLIKLLAATSFKVNDKLSVGFSVGSSMQNLDLELPLTFQTGALAGITAMGDLSAKDNFAFVYTLGAQYKITKNTVVGLSFISESRSNLDGKTDLFLPDAAPESALFTNKQAEYDSRTDFEWPRIIGAGISHKIGESNKIAFDLLWFDWSAAFDSLDISLTGGDNMEFNKALGNKLKDDLPLDWDSTFSFRFGYEYFHKGKSDNVFRLGYIFDDNPVPKDTQIPLIPGTLKHTFTTGYSHKWDKWELDTAFQYMISDKDSVGTGQILGGDFDNSSMRVNALILFLGMKYNF